MRKLFIPTPLLYSHPLSRHTGKQIYLKFESLQPSGSFKDRGIGSLCVHYAQSSTQGFICSSGGNAGLAVAFAAKELKLPATIVIPENTPPLFSDKFHAENAEVIIYGETWNDAHVFAREKAEQEHLTYIHPFDHPLIWKGYQTIIHEIKEAAVKPDAIIVSVGGGGLYSGLVEGCDALGWSDVMMITAETQGAASFAEAFKAKKRIKLEKIQTIARTLGAKQICERAFQLSQQHPTTPQVVTDQQAIQACLHFADDHRQLVEPACGAALSIAYEKSPILDSYDKIVIIVCGGSGVSLSLLNEWKKLL